MKIEIEFSAENYWTVRHDGKYADKLGYDEMLGLVAAITMPEKRPAIHWLKTPEQHKAQEEYFKNLNTKSSEVEFESPNSAHSFTEGSESGN